jgi:hypothetical protein
VQDFRGLRRVAGALPQHRRRAVGQYISFVGLDVHKATITVCVAEAGRDGEVRFVGEIANQPAALDKLVARLGRGGRDLRFVYEAGPCGYGVYRHLRHRGHECIVTAPNLIPRKPGERIKTDRRDATTLARLHRAGELTPVWVPEPEHGPEHCSGQAGSGQDPGRHGGGATEGAAAADGLPAIGCQPGSQRR